MTQARLLNQKFTFNPITDRILLPHQFVWDVEISSNSKTFISDSDYSFDAENNQIVRLLNGRIDRDAPVLISYLHSSGVVVDIAYLFNLDNLIQLPHTDITNLVIKSADTITYTRDTDFTLDSASGRISRLKAGKIAQGEDVDINFSFFGKLVSVVRMPINFNEIGEIILANKPIYNVVVERLLDNEYIPFVVGIDYSVESQQGVIDHVLSGSIVEGELIYVSYQYPSFEGLYLTPADFINAYGIDETIELTNLENPQAKEPNFNKLATAIELMSGEMDIFLDNHFALPLNPVTEGMKWKCGVLVRYHLDHNQQREDVRKRYEDVMTQLKAIAKGDLGSGSEGEGQQTKIGYKPGYRIFTMSNLEGYGGY